MKLCLRSFVYSISIVFLIAGCARKAAVPVREGHVTGN